MHLTVRMSRRQGIGSWRAWPCGRGRKYLLAVIGILLYDECNGKGLQASACGPVRLKAGKG